MRLDRSNGRGAQVPAVDDTVKSVEGEFPERRFDTEFRRKQGDEAIFRAAGEMVEMAGEAQHGRKPTPQRTVRRID